MLQKSVEADARELLVPLVLGDQHLTRLLTVRTADDAEILHAVDELCRLAEADGQLSLKQRGRDLAGGNRNVNCVEELLVVVKSAVVAGVAVVIISAASAGALLLGALLCRAVDLLEGLIVVYVALRLGLDRKSTRLNSSHVT